MMMLESVDNQFHEETWREVNKMKVFEDALVFVHRFYLFHQDNYEHGSIENVDDHSRADDVVEDVEK
jgi:hypothetical protein